MTPLETSDSPPRERTLLPGIVRFGVMLLVAGAFGLIIAYGDGEKWPAWAYYPPKLAVALLVGFGLGIAQERPFSGPPEWRSLRWRVAAYQATHWSIIEVLFLSSLNVSGYERGWQTLFIVTAILLSFSFFSERLVSRFLCPHCHQFFFLPNPLDGSTFLVFGLSRWRSTRCQHCDWPLWKPTIQE